MVVFADKSREAELIDIWQQSFGDEEAYIRMFLSWNVDRCRIVIKEADGKAVSVAYLLPVTFVRAGQKPVSCWYLYAAATLPEYRGRGYFKEIMAYIKEHIPEPVILVPGEASLISYYEKLGLRLWLRENCVTVKVGAATKSMSENEISKTEFSEPEIFKIDFQRYKARRDKILAGQDFIQWDEHFMKYIFHENAVCGGGAACICTEGTEFVVLYRKAGWQLKVLEILPHDGYEGCISVLLEATGCEEADICLNPAVMSTEYFPGQKERGYFNLSMG